MIKLIITLLLNAFPMIALAANKPSMTSMWVELVFLIAMLIVLKIASFSNKAKFILFGVYVLSGIITQTIWFPVILFVGLYVYFNKNNEDY
ncbi:MAG: hypothetical protein L3J83_03295 [Proteobacteria bacterium]|nr:hypothetical protein [Pseudomonadota bacterium]